MIEASLTKQEEKVYKYIKQQVKLKGYPPSVREVCHALKFKSTSSAHQYIWRLVDKGLLSKPDYKTRAMTVLNLDKTVSLPLIKKKGMADLLLAPNVPQENFSVSEKFFDKINLKNDNYLIEMPDNSMNDKKIYAGDYLVVTNAKTLKNKDIVVSIIEEQIFVKIYCKSSDKIWLEPKDNSIDSQIFKNNKIMGKVVGLIRKF